MLRQTTKIGILNYLALENNSNTNNNKNNLVKLTIMMKKNVIIFRALIKIKLKNKNLLRNHVSYSQRANMKINFKLINIRIRFMIMAKLQQ